MRDDENIPVAAITAGEPAKAPSAVLPSQNPQRPNRFVVLWRKIGEESLGFSYCSRTGILFVMASIFVARQMVDKQVDFLPGGATQQGAEASADLA